MHRAGVGPFLFTLALSLVPATAEAQTPVEYVRHCSAFPGFFYMPGTETCVNVNTGETKKVHEEVTTSGVTQQQILDLEQQSRRNKEGVAMSFALPTATVDPGKSFGAAMNVGTFDGAVAVGIGGAFRATDGLTVNGAVAYGIGEGTIGGNIGVNLSC